MADDAKFHCPSFNFWGIGCAMCSWALSWRRIEPFLLTNAGCRCCGFQCISLICSAYFSNVIVSLEFSKLLWIRWPAGHHTVTMTFLGASLTLGKCFGASSQSNHWAGHCWLLYKIHFLSHIIIWLRNVLLFHRTKEDDTLKWWNISEQTKNHVLMY